MVYTRDANDVSALAKVVSAFLNGQGGHLYIGFDDRGRAVGLPNAAEPLGEALALALSKRIAPREVFKLSLVSQGGRDGLLLDVPEGARKPYVFDGAIWRRQGDALRKASASDIAKMVTERERVDLRWERRLAVGVELSDLDQEYWQRLISRATERFDRPWSPEEAALSLHLVEDGWPTQAAVALFARHEHPAYPQLYAQTAAFEDEKRTSIGGDFNRVYLGALALVEHLTERIRAHWGRASSISGLIRTEHEHFPLPVVREALVNALMHRDYADRGGVQVRFFPGRMEVWNPGHLSESLILSNEQFSISRLVNPDIARVFQLYGYAETMGVGMWAMRERMQKAGLPPPEWRNEANGVLLTLRAENSSAPVAPALLNERLVGFLREVYPDETLTSREYRNRFASDVSDRTARLDLLRLVELGFLTTRGATRSLRYIRTDRPFIPDA